MDPDIDAHRGSKLPVALFVTGGGGVTGRIYIPSQLPSPWVSRSQENIVVTINYCVNIFGSMANLKLLLHAANTVFVFVDPKSRAVNKTSLSLLDVRAAVEWVPENIEAFGGNPENIMVREFNYMVITFFSSFYLWLMATDLIRWQI